jgi:hypothetical protein
MYHLNNAPGLWQAKELCAPPESLAKTRSREDEHQAQPKQAGIQHDHQHLSAKTVHDLFAPIETWNDKETKRVGWSFRKHLEKVIRLAKDRPFEQALQKRVETMLASEGAFAKHIAHTRSRSPLSHVAEHLPLWRAHRIAYTMGYEVVNDTFSMLLQQDPYYHISIVRKESLWIPLFASELHQCDKQNVLFWTKQGGRIVYRNRCETHP